MLIATGGYETNKITRFTVFVRCGWAVDINFAEGGRGDQNQTNANKGARGTPNFGHFVIK